MTGRTAATPGIAAVLTSDPYVVPSTTPLVTFPDPAPGALGYTVALSADGQTALISEYPNDSVYLYVKSGGVWPTTPTFTFVCPCASPGNSYGFGQSMALSQNGQVALIGVPGFSGGVAYLYDGSSGWSNTPAVTFTPPSVGGFKDFGQAVALSADGQIALIGTGYTMPNGDGALLYDSSQGWILPVGYLNENLEAGESVALSADGGTALIGTGGNAYVYTAPYSVSTTTDIIPPPQTGSRFGWSVALSSDGQTALIGAPDVGFGPGDTGDGAAYVYTQAAGNWTQAATLTSAPGSELQLGYSVALSSDGQIAVVAGPQSNGSDDSVANLYTAASGWSASPVATFTNGITGSAGYADSVAMSGDGETLLVGSAAYNKAYIYGEAEPTATSITSVTPDPVVGQPITVDVTTASQDASSGAATPAGQVDVTDGTSQCQAAMSGSDGTATGSCQLTENAPGQFSLTATYQGAAGFGQSQTSSPTMVTVAAASTTTSLPSAPLAVSYGNEQSLTLSVTVAPQYTGAPSGQVTMTSGAKTLCTVQLTAGTGSCSPSSATALGAGNHPILATYQGSTGFTASEATGMLTVRKEPTTTKLTLSPASVTAGKERSLKLSVAVTARYSGTPAGQVTVTSGGKALCTIRLSAGAGSCSPSSGTVLGAGVHQILASYPGGTNVAASGATKTLTVKRAASLPVSLEFVRTWLGKN